MPTTAEDIRATRELRQTFGEDRGSCFGVTDASRLRPSFARAKMPRNTKNHRRPTVILLGEKIATPSKLYAAYKQGVFYYQFPVGRNGRTSRIMVCDNLGELDWLATQVSKGNAVVIRPFR